MVKAMETATLRVVKDENRVGKLRQQVPSAYPVSKIAPPSWPLLEFLVYDVGQPLAGQQLPLN